MSNYLTKTLGNIENAIYAHDASGGSHALLYAYMGTNKLHCYGQIHLRTISAHSGFWLYRLGGFRSYQHNRGQLFLDRF